MTASEDEIVRDQSERNSLQKAIADVETALPVSTPGTRRILEKSLEGMRGRIATLDKKISDAVTERDTQARAEVAKAAMLAQKEARLSESEKQTYSGFLAKEFFTKKDFGKLEEFYTHSWNRLSENGKDEMSKRIDEGIRRHEFKFDELPKIIQEKENEHRAAKAEKKPVAQSKSDKDHVDATLAAKPPERSAMRDIDLGSIDLKNAKLADVTSPPSAVSIPAVSASQATRRC